LREWARVTLVGLLIWPDVDEHAVGARRPDQRARARGRVHLAHQVEAGVGGQHRRHGVPEPPVIDDDGDPRRRCLHEADDPVDIGGLRDPR
jgi:hypothetical protein